MLRRAASNAYSWWWASHVRTKQSKWLEENLQDIEKRVKYALKLLEDEGDSFAKRAEMYYKRRPELISFVEESFKAYRALAERYDHISKELQNANTTIASAFPDQVPEFAMNEEDDDVVVASVVSPRNRKTHASHQNIPKVPDLPVKNSETAKNMVMSKKEHNVVNKSGLSKTEAVEEIDKLQKDILALQTEKEFVKSSYENGLAKYWEIEKCIMEKQGSVCSLQDEFDEGAVVIEDKEAQILMSTTALNSCQEKLDELRDRHEKNSKESDITREQIRESTEELGNLSDALLGDGRRNHEIYSENEKLESLGDKSNEDFDDSEAKSCLTITDVADKIDELVNDVINLESLFSSQAALIHRLREEIDDLKSQIRALQQENNTSESDENIVMRKKLREMEEKLKGIKDIDQAAGEESNKIGKQLTRAHLKLSYLSERLRSMKQGGEEENLKATTNVPNQNAESLIDTKLAEETPDDSIVSENVLSSPFEVVIAEKDHTDEVNQEETTEKEASLHDLEKHILSPKSGIETEDEAFLQKLLAHGIEGREKHLLTEYTKVLRNYKEVKKMLDETKSENTLKDEQVRVLNHKLNTLQKGKSDGDDLRKRDKLFMLIYREDNAMNAVTGQKQNLSPNEEKLGKRIDALLSENLNLLVRFSNTFGQIQQFDTGIRDLHVEILKLIKQKNQDGENNTLKSNVRPIYKHLSEIRTEMTVWLEKSLLLREEINFRASTLSDIQNEITKALKMDSEDSETKLTIYQGAKFEGEVSNMIKENKRISEELGTGLDQVTKLKKDADTTLEKLSKEFLLSESNTQSSQDHKTRIPLRSFIFDNRPKKQRLSIFSCIQPSLYKKMKPATGS